MAYYPGQKVSHKSPRRITFAAVLIAVVCAVAIYLAWTFFPPYWRYYKSSSVMTDEAQKAYAKRREQHSWGQIQSSVYAQVRSELLAVLKIPEEQLHLEVEKRHGDVYVTASWRAVARWPLWGKTTTLRFKEEVHFPLR